MSFIKPKIKVSESVNSLSPDGNYFPVSPDTLNPEVLTHFQVYLKRGSRYVLYTKEREYFSENLKRRLVENGIESVYIPYHQQSSYEAYVMENFKSILNDSKIPLDVRSRVFLETTTKRVRSIFTEASPVLDEDILESIHNIVSSSLSFLSTPEAISSIAQFISHDYETFSHSVHVFTYTMMLMKSLKPELEESSLIEVGVGALLHDIGKIHIPTSILNKPGPLNDEEWVTIKMHPVHGMRICTSVPLAQTSLNCIMFHHEKYDGTGYPTGMKKEEIPLPVRIITCCDVYDAITSKRPYSAAQTTFEALKIMNNQMKTAFDRNVFKAFIEILSKTRKNNGKVAVG